MQDRITHKTSTILISSGGKVRSFRSLADVPQQMRERLIQSTSGPYSATLLIADEAGRQEVLRSLRGQPSAVESRWMRSFNGQPYSVADVGAAAGVDSEPTSVRAVRWRRATEIALLVGIGLCLWLLAAWK